MKRQLGPCEGADGHRGILTLRRCARAALGGRGFAVARVAGVDAVRLRGPAAVRRRGRNLGAEPEPLAILTGLHARDDQALDLGGALEQLVDLRVAEELLQRA